MPTQPTLTLRQAQAATRALGFTLRSLDGEYEVRPRGARNDAASYYTTDLQDAVDTAEGMVAASRRWKQRAAAQPALTADERALAATDALAFAARRDADHDLDIRADEAERAAYAAAEHAWHATYYALALARFGLSVADHLDADRAALADACRRGEAPETYCDALQARLGLYRLDTQGDDGPEPAEPPVPAETCTCGHACTVDDAAPWPLLHCDDCGVATCPACRSLDGATCHCHPCALRRAAAHGASCVQWMPAQGIFADYASDYARRAAHWARLGCPALAEPADEGWPGFDRVDLDKVDRG